MGLASSAFAQQQAGSASSSSSTAVIAAERAIWESLKSANWTQFDKTIAGMTYVTAEGIVVWKSGNPSQFQGMVMRSYSWDSLDTRVLSPDVVVLSYKATVDATENGKNDPSPVYMLSVWQRKNGRWIPVAHSETVAASAR
jgi:hypothetical protein